MAGEWFEKGLKNRKEVLGAAHVERSLAAADDFSRPYQELVTEYCWGAVWDRPGLSRKTRSLLNLAMLTALNREEEFKLHVRAAFRNGVTKEEIREVLRRAGGELRLQAGPRGLRRDGARGDLFGLSEVCPP
jgi:4-carboxymuconolactone decarboxylase